jgi:hypothetical protein
MAHFIDKFSSVLSGPACPVAVDDIEKKIRYPLEKDEIGYPRSIGANGGEAYFNVYAWKDYPGSHYWK